MKAEKGCEVMARCVVRDMDGTVIDPGEKPFRFTIGAYGVIVGIEHAVIGHTKGDQIRFICEPKDAYGPHRPELVFEAVRENLPPGLELEPGMVLSPGGSNGRFHLKVLELTEKGARVDGNHPLAGQTLSFELEILDVVRMT